MSEVKHTPGPWRVAVAGSLVNIRSCEATPRDLALLHRCLPNLMPEDENMANAKLIAAAPDLLAALQSITASYDKLLEAYGKPHGWGTIESDAAKAAIAKAGGAA